ncbi:MAG: hypothetical protein A2Y37_01075 [Spirochaetes bacterium GWB1_60_80]|nr:MAG: hypothetical protein A2Y37_01075 [Spirochaetes bacterium GWB1_60_80]
MEAYQLSGGRPKEAIALAERLYKLAGAAADYHYQALSRYIAGFSEINRGEFAAATRFFEQGHALCLAHDLEALSVKFHNAFGALFFQLGSLTEALEEYEAGLAKARHLGLLKETGHFLINLSQIAQRKEHGKDALAFLDEAMTISEQLGDEVFTSSFLNNLGECLFIDGQIDRAEAVTRQSRALAARIGFRKHELIDLKRLADIALLRGDYQGALQLAGEALAAGNAEGFPEDAADAQLTIARAYGRLEDYPTAIREFDAAIARIEAQDFKLRLGPALEGRAQAKYSAGRFEEAYLDMCRSVEATRVWYREDSTRQIASLETAFRLDKIKQEAVAEREKRQQLEAINANLRIIGRIGKALTSTLEPADILSRMWQELKPSIPLGSLGIGVYSDAMQTIDFPMIVADGVIKPGLTIYMNDESSLAALCVRRRETIYLASADEARQLLGASSMINHHGQSVQQTMVFIPMLREEIVTGLLTIQCTQTAAYSRETVEMLEAVSSYAAIAIENAKIMAKVEGFSRRIVNEKQALEQVAVKSSWLAEHDALTGLPNRLLLGRILEQTIGLAGMNGTKVVLLYMDLDGFKPVNDRYGHDTGDRILVLAAERLSRLFRSGDLVARVGGDEFIALAGGIKDRDSAKALAGKIGAVFREPFAVPEGRLAVGISVGFAIFPDDAADASSLVRLADQAMYNAKHGPQPAPRR